MLGFNNNPTFYSWDIFGTLFSQSFNKMETKIFRTKTKNNDFFVILTTLTVFLNLIQTLFDADKQNETVEKYCKKKAAFTLAEVLITLGIIGVVAAMTIPTLLADVTANKYRSKYKKVVSTLSQAARMSQAQYGFDYATALKCGSNGGEENPEDVMTICSLLNGTLTGITYYNKLTDIKTKDGKSYSITKGPFLSVSASRRDLANYSAYTLNDGTIIGIPNRYNDKSNCSLDVGKQVTDGSTELAWCIAIIDVNGSSLPNKEIGCTYGSYLLSKNTCVVKNRDITDVFVVRLHDGIVEPATAAARYVIKTAK
jgi:prepilin-type N-terminal cleavage/methylation domain-containing protein